MTRTFERILAAGALLAGTSVFGCGNPRLKPCDIGKESCQDDVYYALVRMRGDGLDPFLGVPPIRTLSREGYRKELEAQAERSAKKRAQQGKPKVNPTNVVLELLGMITPSQAPAQTAVNNEVSNVIAYYSSRDQRVTVIERPPDSDRLADTELLLHELVHAFQDRDVGLGGKPTSSDEVFARTAITEGEAVHYEYLGVLEMKDKSADDYDWANFYHSQRDGRRATAARSSSPYFQMKWFVYPLGGYMTTGRWLTGGNGAIRSLQAHWPRSSLAFMLGPDAAVPKKLGLSCRVPEAPGETRFSGGDVLGAVQLYALLLAQTDESQESICWDLALEWRGDNLMVFFDEATEAVAGSWRIRLSGESAAADMVDLFSETDTLRVDQQGADVVVSVASDGALLSEFGGIEDCG